MDKRSFSILLASTIAAAFLGSFLASMVIFNHRPHKHHVFNAERMSFPASMDVNHPIKFIEEQEEAFNKMDDELEDSISQIPQPAFIYLSNTGLKTLETDDFYKITIDLKPFNNDEKNVNVKINGRKVLISAKYSSKAKKDFSSAQFSQVLVFPEKIHPQYVKKQKQGNLLVITIPKDID